MNKNLSFFIGALLVLLLACSSSHLIEGSYQSKNLDLAKLSVVIDSIAKVEMRDQHIPGMVLAIVKDGRTILKKGYGYADMYSGARVNPDQTVFRIGSVSKAVTLLALTRLIDQGLVGYEDDVMDYFPHIKNPNDYTDPLRIKHLLSHTTGLDQVGLGRHTWQLDLPLSERQKLRPSISSFLEEYAIRRAPAGQLYIYDTYGTTLAGAIIEKVVGLPYKKAMQHLLFEPLGMSSSGVDLILDNLPHMARGHGFNEGAYQLVPYELYTTTPASSIDATAADMAKLLEVLTGNGSNSTGLLFSEKTMERVLNHGFRPHPEFVGTSHGLHEGFYYGIGDEAYKVRSLAHGGDMYGYKAQFRVLPEYGLGVFIASNRNRESGGGRVRIERSIINALLEELGVPKRTKPHIIPGTESADLKEYTGDYFYGVHCHTCNEEDFSNGAWRSSWTKNIVNKEGFLIMDDEKYYQRDKDVFVREDGYDMILFSRNAEGRIISLQPEDDNNTFVRL